MSKQRFVLLLERLHEATRSGKVRWEETAKEGAFRIALGDGLVRIEKDADFDAARGPYEFIRASLITRHGETVDELVASDDDEQFDETDQLIEKLYNDARTSALSGDELVDSMLADLKAGKTRALPPDHPQR